MYYVHWCVCFTTYWSVSWCLCWCTCTCLYSPCVQVCSRYMCTCICSSFLLWPGLWCEPIWSFCCSNRITLPLKSLMQTNWWCWVNLVMLARANLSPRTETSARTSSTGDYWSDRFRPPLCALTLCSAYSTFPLYTLRHVLLPCSKLRNCISCEKWSDWVLKEFFYFFIFFTFWAGAQQQAWCGSVLLSGMHWVRSACFTSNYADIFSCLA